MGRIKTLLVKRIARKLVKEHSQEFTPEFDKNKPLVQKYTTATHKIRNLIAGCAARLVKKRVIAEKEPRKRFKEEDLSKFYE